MKTRGVIVLVLIVAIVVGGLVWSSFRYSQNFLQYSQSHLKFNKSDNNAMKNIVFLGDSITKFEDWNVLFGTDSIINSGFPGNTTDDIKNRVSSALNSNPQKIFLMIGINDLLNGKDAEYVLRNYAEILDKMKEQSPNAEVYVQSILPVNNDVLKSETVDNQEIIALNSELKLLSDEKNVFFVDLHSSFYGSNGEMKRTYSWDGLHPNSHGYAIWKDLIIQYVK